MPRQARQKSASGIYHIILRGINQQTIFEDEEDKEKFLAMLKKYKEKSGYLILGYCIMDNHVHLLIKEGAESLESSMKRIGVSYVYWYNMKYKRSGHLFQDRYKSETVEDDAYLLTVLRYIQRNPLMAGITMNLADYQWSSYREYVEQACLVDVGLVSGMFDGNKEKLKEFFAQDITEQERSVLEAERNSRMNDEEAREKMKAALGPMTFSELQRVDKEQRNEMLRQLKQIEGVSIRQIARITGLSVNIVAKV